MAQVVNQVGLTLPVGGQVWELAEDVVAATVGNVHLTIYRGQLTEDALRRSHRSHRWLQKRMPEGTVVLSYVVEGSPMPGAAVRRLASELTKEVAGQIRASTVVLPGVGFWASASRSVLTAIFVLAGQPYPSHACPSVEAAAQRLRPYLKGASVQDVERSMYLLLAEQRELAGGQPAR